ncbi:MAG TPA: NADH-quinone oxidoreductase subunit NuoG [Candidatus Acidoferrales bacterium]|nr:NADH-quinone oxidoreductase subunit NuoG [Candidatus Acidoferrales bacterium]
MTTIYVEDRSYTADPKQNLLHACLSLGFNLPYFCWHPAMGSVGACRQCAVKHFKDEKDTRGKLVMACMTAAAEGTRISIKDPEAVAFRAGIIEGMMASHPHDCPVCDEGGHCHLQDMTVMTGHDYRRYSFLKRTFRNQYLGPLVNHEMNRCIQCYRCVRFYREYAGGRDFDAFGLRDQVYFGRQADGVLENEFSGNLVEVCPTGVFTDKTLKQHYTRKWDLQMAPSVCVHCGLGCNTTPGERYGMLRQIVTRYNSEVNGYFLCDRGRYGYEFVNSVRRIRQPRLKCNRELTSITKTEALQRVAPLVTEGKRAIGIGSPRASLESNFLLRTLVGPERFYAGVSDSHFRLISIMIEILRAGPARSPSLHEIELSDAVLILGEDVTNIAPRMALSLRQSVRQQPMQIADKMHIPLWDDHSVRNALQDSKGPLFIATPAATRLDDVATKTYRAAPDDIARLGFAIAHLIDKNAPAVSDLSADVRVLADDIANALKKAQRSLVVSGPGCNNEAVIQAAANVTRALYTVGLPATLSFIVPECNSFGLALIGGAPLSQAFKAVGDGAVDTIVILENDLYRRAPARFVDAFLNGTKHLIALDHLLNQTAERATLAIPAGTFAEADGTLVSSEGRAQRFYQVFVPEGDIQASWQWLRDVMTAAGRQEGNAWKNIDDVAAAIGSAIPALAQVQQAAPDSAFRIAGEKIHREPERYSGRTAMLANISVHEPKPPDDPNTPFSFSMEGSPDQPPAALIPFFWSPGWSSIQSTNFYQTEIAGPLRGGDPGVRLMDPALQLHGTYFDQVPTAFAPSRDEWLLVPLYHIFGSEELSFAAPGVAELAPKPYVAVNADDAKRLGVEPGEQITIKLDGTTHSLPAKIRGELPLGIAGLPAGFPGLAGISLPIGSVLERNDKPSHMS